MTENGLFILGRPDTHPHDILWAIHDIKNHGRSEGEESFGEFSVTVDGRAESDAVSLHVSLIRACVRGIRLLNPSEAFAY